MTLNLKKSTLSWSLEHHERFGDTDILPVPSEYTAIRGQWSSLLPDLMDADIGRWQTSATRKCLTPKSRFGFRIATQLDPLDSLVYTGLVYEIAKDLETYRDPKISNRVFSHRVARGVRGQLFDPQWNFDRFKAHVWRSALAPRCKWIVSTDVADFYSRIYHHPLENGLRSASSKSEHVDALMRFLSQWNFTVSSGLPVGAAATRLLAEIALVDVDRTLVDSGIEYCRFSDDFRLFARSEAEAHRSLAILAVALGESHLTLSERKTTVQPVARFKARNIDGERPDDAATLSDRVASILQTYGYENDVYSTAELVDLPPEMVRELDALGLNGVLVDASDGLYPFDTFIVSLALRRLAQIEDNSVLPLVVQNLHQFTSVFPQLVNYLDKVTPVPERGRVGSSLLKAVLTGASGHPDYQMCWLLELFSRDARWATNSELITLLESTRHPVVRPLLIELMGERKNVHWFRQNRRDALNLGGWELRAFIRGARCMRRNFSGEMRPL